jgi:hypothetical protein
MWMAFFYLLPVCLFGIVGIIPIAALAAVVVVGFVFLPFMMVADHFGQRGLKHRLDFTGLGYRLGRKVRSWK